jgi:hypothetical protein
MVIVGPFISAGRVHQRGPLAPVPLATGSPSDPPALSRSGVSPYTAAADRSGPLLRNVDGELRDWRGFRTLGISNYRGAESLCGARRRLGERRTRGLFFMLLKMHFLWRGVEIHSSVQLVGTGKRALPHAEVRLALRYPDSLLL